jgi:hypothetical protein
MAYLAGLCAALYLIALLGDFLMSRCWREK